MDGNEDVDTERHVSRHCLQPGWRPLYIQLVRDIETIDTEARVEEAKEKFARIRIYLNRSSPEIDALLREAEDRSATICETCGRSAEVCVNDGFTFRTLCPQHRDGGFRPARTDARCIKMKAEIESAGDVLRSRR